MVYLNETVFTFHTFRSKGWAHRRDRIKVIDSDLKVQTLALIAAISEDGGLIDFEIHPRAINTEVFVAFVRQLSEKLAGDDFALFLDNLSDHKTKAAKLLFEELNIGLDTGKGFQRTQIFVTVRGQMIPSYILLD